jgi:hypothetical protein
MKFIKRKNLLTKCVLKKELLMPLIFYGIIILRKEIEFKEVLTDNFNNLSSKYI